MNRLETQRPLISSGELDHEINIQEATGGSPSASGETTKTWATVLSCWAKVEPTWCKEYERAMQQVPEMTLMLKLRYSPDVAVTTAMRVVMGTRTFAIESARNINEANVALQLVCKENT